MNLLFQDITLLDEHFCIQEHYDLEVADGYIKQMGPTGSFTPQPGCQRYTGQHRLLLPGLYNIHTHLAMNLLRGYAENMKLQDWLFTKIFPFEAQFRITSEIKF